MSSLYLHPGGWVGPCCWSDSYLGRVSEAEGGPLLSDIWRGATMTRLREAMERSDFSLGCRHCASAESSGDAQWSGIGPFDQFRSSLPVEWPLQMHFALSNTCNLMCVMCHGDLSSAIRSRREGRPPMADGYGDRFFEDLRQFLPGLRVAIFTGGEPFLCRATRRVWDMMIEEGASPRVEVTTNGTVWTPKAVSYAEKLKMDLLVSVDGATAATCEAIRVGVDHAALMTNLDAMQSDLARWGGRLSINFCLMVDNVHELGSFLAQADDRDVDVSIRTVHSPPRHSLFRLDRAELATIVAGLEAEDAHRSASLGRNLAVWTQELDRLRRHLGSLGDDRAEGPLDADEHPSPEADVAERAQPHLDELAAWSGAPLLSVRVIDQIVATVDAPAWAAELRTERWPGMGGLEIIGDMEASLGGPVQPEAEQVSPDILLYVLRFGPPESEIETRVVRTEGADPGGRRVTMLHIARHRRVDRPAT